MKKKLCWIAKEFNAGWKVGLSISKNDTRWIRGVFFASEKDVETALNGGVLFVHMEKK